MSAKNTRLVGFVLLGLLAVTSFYLAFADSRLLGQLQLFNRLVIETTAIVITLLFFNRRLKVPIININSVKKWIVGLVLMNFVAAVTRTVDYCDRCDVLVTISVGDALVSGFWGGLIALSSNAFWGWLFALVLRRLLLCVNSSRDPLFIR